MPEDITLLDFLPPSEGGDLTERVGTISPGRASITCKDARIPELYYVPWEKRYEAAISFCGFSVVQGDKLHRQIPRRHPFWDATYATSIDIVGKGFRGLEDTGIPDQPYIAKYKIAELSVTYEPLRFAALTDDFADGGEHERYIFLEPRSGLELLHLKQGSLAFIEGPPASDNTKRIFQGEAILRTPKPTFTVYWYQVPEEWIVGADGTFPNLTEMNGRVNNGDFIVGSAVGGNYIVFPKWTCLLQEPTFTKYTSPLNTGHTLDPKYYYDITLPFVYFNPDNHFDDAHLGHQLAPFRGDDVYYLVERTGFSGNPTAGKHIYQDGDMQKIFKKAV